MTRKADQDHDQRFKTLIREFLREFIRLFFPTWYARFDFDRVEWLDKEIFLDPPQGEKRTLDLVAKVPVKQVVAAQRPGQPDSYILLIHIEVEADDRLTRIRPRMHDYYKGLRDRYQLPVWSLALYLRVGLDGVGWDVYEEYLWEERVLQFKYPYVGLPALQAERYVNSEVVLGAALAALMRVPEEQRAVLRAQALHRIGQSGENDYRQYLLLEFVEAYWQLSPSQQQEFDRLMETAPYRETRTMMLTSFEKGTIEGQRRLLQKQLEKRFGPLPPAVVERLRSWPYEDLEELGERLLEAHSLKELGLED
jgi:hypothetical protein